MTEEWQRTFGAKLGRPCYRVELPPELYSEADLLGWLVHDDLKPLAAVRAEVLTHGCTVADADALLSRVQSVLCDADVVAVLHPKPEAANG